MTDTMGPLKGANYVEQVVQEHIEKWMSTYLRAVEPLYDYDKGSLEDFRSIETSPEFERWPEEQIPGLLLVSPGMIQGSVKVEGNGAMRARFILGLGIVVSADTKENSNDLAKVYGIAAAALMVQKPSCGGHFRGTDLEDMSFDELGSDGYRTQASALVVFSVDVPEIINTDGGPLEPSTEPPEESPKAEKVTVTASPVATVGDEE